MVRPRCPECGRLHPASDALPSLRGISEHLSTLRAWGAAFTDEGGPDPSDFLGYLALNCVDLSYQKPAGNPNQVGSRRRKAA